jgi:pantetheine-phosphate adenylyltransferase
MKLAVYTGSFDPVTRGHLDVIRRSADLVDRLIVGIGVNREKKSLFSPVERQGLMERVISGLPHVEVRCFEGLAVNFVRQCGATVMIRGIRPLTDIAAEFTMTMANRQLDPGLETIFLMADNAHAHVSSSLIKQLTPLASDQQLAEFVPTEIIDDLRNKLSSK